MTDRIAAALKAVIKRPIMVRGALGDSERRFQNQGGSRPVDQ